MTERRTSGLIILPAAVIVPAGAMIVGRAETDDQYEIRHMLNGLIKRDCEAMSADAYAAWAATPAGQAEIAKRKERQTARDRGDLVMVSLTDRREDGSSLRWLEVDRAGLRRLIEAGYTFDAKTTAWAQEGHAP